MALRDDDDTFVEDDFDDEAGDGGGRRSREFTLARLANLRPLINRTRGSVGRSETLAANDRLAPILALDGADELGAVVTATLDFVRVGAAASGDVLRARAQIEWGAGGRRHLAEIDIGLGVQITVPASALRISAANEGTQADIVVGASVAYGARSGSGMPTRTLYRDSAIAAAATVNFTIPTFVRTFTAFWTPQNAQATIRFLDSDSTIVAEFQYAGGGVGTMRVPLPNDARTVRLVNGSTQIDLARIIFEIGL